MKVEFEDGFWATKILPIVVVFVVLLQVQVAVVQNVRRCDENSDVQLEFSSCGCHCSFRPFFSS